MFLSSIEILWSLLNKWCRSRAAGHLEAVWSRSTLFASILLLNNKQTLSNASIMPHFQILHTGPRSAVGNVSDYRCVSDCRSRGREFDPGPVPYFRGDWSWNNFYGHSPPFRWFIQEGLLSVTSESMCTNYCLTPCSSLPRKKCGQVNWPSRNDHSCWHGT